jgi:hypothetical protein
MEGKLNAVHTEEERVRIRAEAAERAAAARQEAAQHTHKVASTQSDTPKPATYKRVDKKKVSDDPLEGIKF